MTGIWIVSGLLVLFVLYSSYTQQLVWVPELRTGPERFRTFTECAETYKVGANRRLVARGLVISLFLVSLGLGLSAPSELRRPAFMDVYLLVALCTALMIGSVAGIYYRTTLDRKLIDANPVLMDCFMPMRSRLTGVFVLASIVVMFLLGVWLLSDGVLEGFIPMLLATMIPIFTKRLAIAIAVKNQIPVPDGSDLAQTIRTTLERCEFTPKRVVLIRSTIANAIVVFDGTVFLTTALVALFTKEEVAGVIAHEVCHAKNKDAKRFERRKSLCTLPAILAVIGVTAWLASSNPGSPYIMITSGLAAAVFWPVGTYLYTLETRRTEFRCDAFATEHGYGEALSRCLIDLHRYQGLPLEWTPFEAKLLTHPSLKDRLARLPEVDQPLVATQAS